MEISWLFSEIFSVEMPEEHNKIIEYNQNQKSMMISFVIYAGNWDNWLSKNWNHSPNKRREKIISQTKSMPHMEKKYLMLKIAKIIKKFKITVITQANAAVLHNVFAI